MTTLPSEVMNYIFEFQNTSKLKYKFCIQELNQKFNKKKLIKIIKLIKITPIYSVSKYFNSNVHFYKLYKIIRLHYMTLHSALNSCEFHHP